MISPELRARTTTARQLEDRTTKGASTGVRNQRHLLARLRVFAGVGRGHRGGASAGSRQRGAHQDGDPAVSRNPSPPIVARFAGKPQA